MLLRDDAAQRSCVYERQYYLCLYGSHLLVSVFVSTCTHARIRVFAHHLVGSEIVYSCCVPLVRGPEFRRSPAFCRQPSVHIHKRYYSFAIKIYDTRSTTAVHLPYTYVYIYLYIRVCIRSQTHTLNEGDTRASGGHLSRGRRVNHSPLRHFTVPTECCVLGSRRRATRIRIGYILRTQGQSCAVQKRGHALRMPHALARHEVHARHRSPCPGEQRPPFASLSPVG
jgi:hypothetical protein